MHEKQLLVGASPSEEIADTHWYRPEFDHYLVKQAQTLGVEYWDETVLNRAAVEMNGMALAGTRNGHSVEISADFVVDATGQRGFLHQAMGLPESVFHSMPLTQALFSHFRGVGSFPVGVFAEDQTLPYPPEQAAVHHVFPGGWIWVLKFNNGITSVGVAATDDLARRLDFNSGERAWRQLLEQLPSLAEVFMAAEATVPFVHLPRLAFRSGIAVGERWALLPSAAGFVDPLLSTGFPLTLLGVKRIGCLLRDHWRRKSFGSQLKDYSELTLLELDTAAQLIGALYATMDRFDLFRELALLYFAAASFSEAALRLGKNHLADSFLLCRNPSFARQLHHVCAMAKRPLSRNRANDLQQLIQEAIEPIDAAGLTDRSRHPWYPALVEDLLRGAPKLDACEEEIRAMLRRYGMSAA